MKQAIFIITTLLVGMTSMVCSPKAQAQCAEMFDTITLECYNISDTSIMHLLDRVVDGLANSYHWNDEQKLKNCLEDYRKSHSGDYLELHVQSGASRICPECEKALQINTTFHEQAAPNNAIGYIDYKGRVFFITSKDKVLMQMLHKTAQTRRFAHVAYTSDNAIIWDPPTWIYLYRQGSWHVYMELPMGY